MAQRIAASSVMQLIQTFNIIQRLFQSNLKKKYTLITALMMAFIFCTLASNLVTFRYYFILKKTTTVQFVSWTPHGQKVNKTWKVSDR